MSEEPQDPNRSSFKEPYEFSSIGEKRKHQGKTYW